MLILDRYVTRTFLSAFGIVLLFIFGVFLVIHVFSMIDSLLEVREVLRANRMTVPGVIGRYYLVSIPFFFLRLAPFVTLIAAAIALVRLTRGNEITAMVAAGRSRARIVLPILACALLLTVSMLALQEWAVPRLADARLRLERIAKGDLAGRIKNLPPIVDGHGNTWRIMGYYPVRKTIEEARVLRYRDPETGRVLGRLDVPAAHYREEGPDGPGWYPEGAVLRPAEGTELFGTDRRLPDDRRLGIDLAPKVIELQAARRSREAGKMLSLTEAAELVELHPEIPRQVVSFHSLLTWPLGNLLLLALGLPLIMRVGERSIYVGVGISLVVCAGYFAVDTVCQDMGVRAVLPPVVAAWLPVVFFASLAIALNDLLRG